MANVLNKTADPVDYRVSANTPDFPSADWFINPDTSAVDGVAKYYWRRPLADPVTEMTTAEKAVVDAAMAAATTTRDKEAAKALFDQVQEQGRVLRAMIELMIDEINTLRALHALPPRTKAQARAAIRNAIDTEL